MIVALEIHAAKVKSQRVSLSDALLNRMKHLPALRIVSKERFPFGDMVFHPFSC